MEQAGLLGIPLQPSQIYSNFLLLKDRVVSGLGWIGQHSYSTGWDWSEFHGDWDGLSRNSYKQNQEKLVRILSGTGKKKKKKKPRISS